MIALCILDHSLIKVKMSREFNIEKLKGSDNYHTWCFAIKNYIALKGLTACVFDPSSLKNDKPEDIAKLEQCKATLSLSIESSIFVHIQKCATAKDIWETLKKLYEDKGLTRKISLLRNLISTRLEDKDCMQQYVDQIMDYAHKLTGIGFDISDEWLGAILLAGLTEEFKPLIMAIEASSAKLTADVIVSKLIDSQSANSKGGEALFGKKKYSKEKNNFKEKKCYNCGIKGHISKKCRKPKKEENRENGSANNAFSAFLCKNYSNGQNTWYLDSGASNHMTPFGNLLINKKATSVDSIMAANSAKMPTKQAGDAKMQLSGEVIEIQDILHVPGLAVNLLSINKIAEKGNTITFNKDGCTVKNAKQDIIISCKPENGVYKIVHEDGMCMAAARKTDSALMWHRRLGHLNVQSMKKMRDGAVTGINFIDDDNAIKNCETCAAGKHARQPFKASESQSTGILQLIHTDVIGPMETLSIGDARYVATFTDDYSRKTFIYFLKAKSEVPDRFMDFKAFTENQTGKKIKCVRGDNGTEYQKLKAVFKKCGILYQTSTPYTPQQNGVAERMNRTLVEKAKCLMFDAGLPKIFWAEAMNMAAYLVNRTISSVHNKTPDEMFFGKKVDLSDLKVFGSTVMVQVPKEKRKKWDKNSRKMIFVGNDAQSKGYRCIDLTDLRLVISRDVKFYEKNAEKTISVHIDDQVEDKSSDAPVQGDEEVEEKLPDESVQGDETVAEVTEQPSLINLLDDSDSLYQDTDDSTITTHGPDPDYTPETNPGTTTESTVMTRAKAKTVSTRPFQLTHFAFFTEPANIADIRGRSDEKNWIIAMDDEMRSHQTNDTWILKELPKGRSSIKCKWVFKEKKDTEGRTTRYKARLVAKGFAQKYGVDYTETFSPVVRYTSIRVLMAIAVENDMKIHQMDVITAFLQGDLDEVIYMDQPELYNDGSGRVCKLNKAIYGLKQAGRQWNKKLDDALLKFGLRKSSLDPCIYFSGNNSLIIAIYVDDFLIFYRQEAKLLELKAYLSSTFSMKDVGPAKGCIGMNIHQGKESIEIDQVGYIQDILDRFGMSSANAVGTPSDTSIKLSAQMVNDDNSIVGKVPFQEAVGSLLYLTQATRPDIAFAVNDVSRFNSKHSIDHWNAVKRIMRYLKGTMNYKLRYTKGSSQMIAYTDADWASDIDKRRSCTGLVVNIADGAVSWMSKRQSTVALSSTEAEYIALSSTVCEVTWLKQLLAELNVDFARPAVIYCDNQSTIKLSESDAFRPRTKHIDIRYHHLRTKLLDGIFDLRFLPSAEMTADSLTKAVTKEKTLLCARKMGLTE